MEEEWRGGPEKVALICNNLFDLYKFSAWAGSGPPPGLPWLDSV